MITQLNPPLPLETPKGKGWAHAIIDYSQEHNLLWVVFLNDTGECWQFDNSQIRIVNNLSLGRHVSISNIATGFLPRDTDRKLDPPLDYRASGSTKSKETN